ncbi:MAG: alpha/beta fold hydrolase [Clostridia bacterium]|nr:alpha/beta fold hydrolase [Clostridia bacterium]
MTKRIKTYTFLLLVLAFCSALFVGLNSFQAKAFTGSEQIRENVLYNQTNTYDVKTKEGEKELFDSSGNLKNSTSGNYRKVQYVINYDLTEKNEKANNVMEYAQITVLTHGLGSSAMTWSNNFSESNTSDDTVKFAYDSQSLITKISERVGGACVYWAKITNYRSFRLINITNQTTEGSIYNENSNVVDSITDISKHIIVVFDTELPNDSNNNVYYQFNYMLSKIIYDVSICNGGKLPKVNLVGHSRGGITNLQYALDHPDLVSTMVSLGTPYFGSTTASLFGEEFLGENICKDGLYDVINSDIYNGYATRWNNGYNSLYRNIDVYAFGSYHSVNSFSDLIENDLSGRFSEKDKNEISKYIPLVDHYLSCVNKNYNNTNFLERTFVKKVIDIAPMFIDENIVDLINDEIFFDVDLQCNFWLSDVLVHLDSQLGKSDTLSYVGFKNYARAFLSNDRGVNYLKVSGPDVPVGHNLIARDKFVIPRVVSVIDFALNVKPVSVIVQDTRTTATFLGHNGNIESGTFAVPSTIDGKTVTKIGPFAFAGQDNVTKITIPDTVTEIQEYAFAGLENLTTIEIGEDTQLIRIGMGAFSGCSNLTSFSSTVSGVLNLPGMVTFVKEYAFMGTGFSTINIGQNVDYIGSGAFAKIENLSGITVHEKNPMYLSKDGGLYDTDGWLKQYCIASPNTSFAFPNETCLYIDQYAFAGAENLQSISLNRILTVSDYAFEGCTALTTLSDHSRVKYVGVGALANTNINTTTAEFYTIGEVLYAYNGTDNVLEKTDFPVGITAVSSFAFVGNDNLQEVYLPNSIENIYNCAFIQCANLEKIQYEGIEQPTVSCLSFDELKEGYQLFIRNSIISSFDTGSCDSDVCADEVVQSKGWCYFKDNVVPIKTIVTFVDEQEGFTTSIEFFLGDEVELPNYDVDGNGCIGWQKQDSTDDTAFSDYVFDGAVWKEVLPTITFVATERNETYTLTLYAPEHNDYQSQQVGEYGDIVVLPILQNDTHYTSSWGTYSVNEDYRIVGNTTLMPNWSPRTFNIIYCNTVFGDEVAEVRKKNFFVDEVATTYVYGKGATLTQAVASFGQLDSYSPIFRFVCWCSDPELTTPITEISVVQYDDVYVYARYRYDYGYGSRTGTNTVTNVGAFNQACDSVYVGLAKNNTYQKLLDMGITHLNIRLRIRMWYVKQGTQYIYVYGGDNGITMLQKSTIHAQDTATVKTINFKIPIESVGPVDYVYLRYNASTTKILFINRSDDWKNSQIFYTTTYYTNEADIAQDSYFAFQDPF